MKLDLILLLATFASAFAAEEFVAKKTPEQLRASLRRRLDDSASDGGTGEDGGEDGSSDDAAEDGGTGEDGGEDGSSDDAAAGGDNGEDGADEGSGGDNSEDDDGGAGCFSVFNSVEVQGKGMISMDSLEIGDYVRSGKDFSRVFSFGHLERDVEYDFLQIHTEGSAAPLELTKNHMVFSNDKPVRAEQVSVGDMLGDNKVTDIISTKSTGLYAPITYDGSIVVNGIKSSCYVEMLDHVPADQHQFVHMFFSLQRAACSVNFGWCESETYTDGLSDYSSWAIKTYMYCNNFSAPVQWLLTAICALILPTWYSAEQFFVSPILSLMAVGFLIYKSKTKKSA